MLQEIVERLEGKSLPVGWVQLQSRSPALLAAMVYALAESLPDALAIFIGDAPTFWPEGGWFVSPIQFHEFFRVLESHLVNRPEWAFWPPTRIVLASPFGAIGPEHGRPGDRAASAFWLRDRLAEMRPVIWRTGATVVAASASSNDGDAAWRAEVMLVVDGRPAVDGALIHVSGPSARLDAAPWLWRGLFLDNAFWEAVPRCAEKAMRFRAPWDGIKEPQALSEII